MLECNTNEASFDYTVVLKTTVTELKLAIDGKTGGSVNESCQDFINAVNSISVGGDCTECEDNLSTCNTEKQTAIDNLALCIDAKAVLETEITDLNNQITTLTDSLNTCTTDKETIQSNLDACIADKATLQTALDTANDSITVLENRITAINTRLDTILGHEVIGDENDKLDEIDANVLAIKNAIETKKNDTITTDLSTYSTEIDNMDIATDYGWDRPLEWIPLPLLPDVAGVDGDVFYGLLLVGENSNERINILAYGECDYDLGDGRTILNVPSGTATELSYVYADLSSDNMTSDGLKQVIVKITPSLGSRLTNVLLRVAVTGLIKNGSFSEVKIQGDTISDLNNAFKYQILLQSVEIGRTSSSVDLTSLCAYNKGLVNVSLQEGVTYELENILYYTHGVQTLGVTNGSIVSVSNMSKMAKNAYPLKTRGVIFDLTTCTFCMEAFYNNEQVRELNLVNSSGVTSYYRLASGAKFLVSINLDMQSCTDAREMLLKTYELAEIGITNCSTSIDIKDAVSLPAEQLNNFILTGLVDVSAGDTQVLNLTGTTASANLSQDALDRLTAYNWDLII